MCEISDRISACLDIMNDGCVKTNSIHFYLKKYLFCVCVFVYMPLCTSGNKGQLMGVGSLLYMSSRNHTQVFRLGSKCCYTLKIPYQTPKFIFCHYKFFNIVQILV